MIDDRVLLLGLTSLRERLVKRDDEGRPETKAAAAGTSVNDGVSERPAWALIDWEAVEREAARLCPRDGSIWTTKREDPAAATRESYRMWRPSERSLPLEKRWELLLEAASTPHETPECTERSAPEEVAGRSLLHRIRNR